MKKYLIILFLFFQFIQLSYCQTVSQVNSRNTRRQMEREVFTRWNQFTPRWYFILMHNKYRKGEDRRNILQLAPTLLAVDQFESKSEDMDESTDTLFIQANLKALDRTTNKRYELLGEGRKIEKLNDKINLLHVEAETRNIPMDIRLEAFEHQRQINEAIDLVKEAYIDDAEKGENFIRYQKDLEKFIGAYATVIHHYGNLVKIQGK